MDHNSVDQNSRLFSQMVEEDTIDLLEVFMVLWTRAIVIILSGILVALLAFAGTEMFMSPQYKSTTKVYVLTRQDQTTNNVSYADLQTSTQFTKDYMQLVKSRVVLEQTIAVLNLNMSANQLAQMVSVATPEENSRIMTIEVTGPNPREAKEIADALRECVSIRITEIMDADAVNVVEEGNLPTAPISPNKKKNMAFGGILGIILACAVILLIYFLDDTIKSPDDVEKYLGLSVLTSIPIIDEGRGKPTKKAKKRRR